MNLSLNCVGFLSLLSDALRDVLCEGPQFSLENIGQDAHIYLIGNGGSAAIASHIANDLTKACGKRAHALTDPAILSCMANDYGYKEVFSEQLHRLMAPQDWLIAISSSGQSKNILRAVEAAHAYHGNIVTLSGFDANNPLRTSGHTNYWVPSDNYGVVEISHLAILHGIVNPGVTAQA
jgi:D-sedoheptulose 7-phosphate isomerase